MQFSKYYLYLKIICSFKLNDRGVKQWKFGFGDTSNTHIGYLRPCNFQGHFGVIRCTCLAMVRNTKMVWNGWNLEHRDNSNTGGSTFLTCSVPGHFGSFGALVSRLTCKCSLKTQLEIHAPEIWGNMLRNLVAKIISDCRIYCSCQAGVRVHGSLV